MFSIVAITFENGRYIDPYNGRESTTLAGLAPNQAIGLDDVVTYVVNDRI